MQKIDKARRQAVARGWALTSLDQKSYAAQNGVATRTIREWARRYGVADRPVARAIAIVDGAIAELEALREGLVAETACQVGTEERPVADVRERHAGAAGAPAAVAVPEVEPIKPKPMPVAGFPWY